MSSEQSNESKAKLTFEVKPAKRRWLCALRLHRWSEWRTRHSKTSQVWSWQFRVCLNCKREQRRWLWPNVARINIDRASDAPSDRFYDIAEKVMTKDLQ